MVVPFLFPEEFEGFTSLLLLAYTQKRHWHRVGDGRLPAITSWPEEDPVNSFSSLLFSVQTFEAKFS